MSSLAMQLQEVTQHLGDNEISLLIEVAKRFAPACDTLTSEDLHFIALGDKEYANGETVSHNDIDWD